LTKKNKTKTKQNRPNKKTSKGILFEYYDKLKTKLLKSTEEAMLELITSVTIDVCFIIL